MLPPFLETAFKVDGDKYTFRGWAVLEVQGLKIISWQKRGALPEQFVWEGGQSCCPGVSAPVSFPSAVVIGFSSRVPVLVYFSKFRDVFAQVNSCICKPRAPVSPVRPSRVSPSRPLPGISLVTLSAWVQSDFRMASEHLSVSTHGFIRVCCVRCQALCSARRRQMPVSPPSRSKQSRKGEN